MLRRKKSSAEAFYQAYAELIIVSASKEVVKTVLNSDNLPFIKEELKKHSKANQSKTIASMLCEYVYFHLFFGSRRALSVGGPSL